MIVHGIALGLGKYERQSILFVYKKFIFMVKLPVMHFIVKIQAIQFSIKNNKHYILIVELTVTHIIAK